MSEQNDRGEPERPLPSRTIRRQLRKAGVPLEALEADAGLSAFVDIVAEAYDEFEKHRTLTDHSSWLASEELSEKVRQVGRREELFSTLVSCAPNGVLYLEPDFRCRYANPRASDVIGRVNNDDLLETGWWRFVHRDDREKVASLRLSPEDDSIGRTVEHRLVLDDGEELWVSTTVAPIHNSGELTGWIVHIEDIHQRRQHAESMSFMARHDALTGLLNRRALREKLGSMCADTGSLAVALVDLDRFKLVNDSFGHEAGDHLLIAVAERLRSVVSADDLLCRLGGDEFAVATVLDSADSAARFASEISDALHGPIEFGGRVVYLAGSVGVAFREEGCNHADQLLRDADTAMYKAKRSGLRSWYVFDESFRQEVTRRFLLESELRRAVGDGSIELAYQPIVDTTTGNVVLLEGLARWNNDLLGVVPPLEFISVAEELGLIGDLGRHLLLRACAQLAHWRTHNPDLAVSVNVSSVQFGDPSFVADVRDVMTRYDLPGNALVLELTEGVVLADIDQAISTLKELRRLGVAIALDDFGTGYSSLAYLDQLQVDYLKIDRSFVNALGDTSSSTRLTETIIDLAHRFELRSIAEGVETDDQRSRLAAAGCGYLQGYLLARPMPPDDDRLCAMLGVAPPPSRGRWPTAPSRLPL